MSLEDEERILEYLDEEERIRERDNKIEELLTQRAIVLIRHGVLKHLPDRTKFLIIHRVECLIDSSVDFPNSIDLHGHLRGFHLDVIPRNN